MSERRPASFYWLAALFTLFVLFLYGPMPSETTMDGMIRLATTI